MYLPGVVCLKSHAPDHPNLKVERYKGVSPKLRKTYCIAGFSPEVCFSTFNNTIDAAECAVKERVFFMEVEGKFVAPTRPSDGIYTNVNTRFNTLMRKHAVFANPMAPIQFAESYRARKRQLYLRAVESLTFKPLAKKDSIVNAFLKYEKYNFNKRKVPRVISPRGPRFTVEMGRFIKPIEKKIYSIINTHIYKSPTVLKGMNQAQRGDVISKIWDEFRDPCALSIDAEKFDRHVSEDALQYEHSIYQLFYPRSCFFRWLCAMQRRNRVYINMRDGVLFYKIRGTRMSGDVNTSLGNCLLSTSILSDFISYIRELEPVLIRVINDGDDSVLFFERKYLELIKTSVRPFCLQYGFRMTVEDPVFELEHVVFCQSQPVWGGDGYVMIRDPRVSLAKDCVALQPLDNVKISEMWLAAVGLCGLAVMGGFPIFKSFYESLVRSSNGAKPLEHPVMQEEMWFATMGMNRKDQLICQRSRYSFWLAFGVSPDEQIAIEDFYDSREPSTILDNDRSRFVNLPL